MKPNDCSVAASLVTSVDTNINKINHINIIESQFINAPIHL